MEASAPLDTTPNTDKSSAIVSIKGKEPEGCHGHHEEATEATDTCVICLSPITERAVTVPCNHLVFDFLCLVHWLQQQPNCPLCKAVISAVEYDWRSPTDYKTYRVPQPIAPTAASQRTTQQRSSRGRGRGSGRARGGARDVHRTASADQALARRRQVYALHAYSAHVGTNRRSEYAHFTASTLSSSPALQNRARIFLRRELQVFSFLSTRQRLEFVLEYIVAMLKSMEIKGADGAMVRLAAEDNELSEIWDFVASDLFNLVVSKVYNTHFLVDSLTGAYDYVKKDFKPELEVISLKKKKVSYKASKIGRNIFVTHPDHPDNEEKQVIKVI
ncbi:hypothetical protein MBLNU457_1597t2 [Dothideomycetes sp. NU457]